MLRQITWPVVALVAVIFTAVGFLSYLRVDTGVVVDVLMALGLGGVIGIASGIRSQVNGNTSKQIETHADTTDKFVAALTEAMNQLAKSTPGPTEDKTE